MPYKIGKRGSCGKKKWILAKARHSGKKAHKVKSCSTGKKKTAHKRKGCKYGRRKGSKRCRKHRKK